MPSLDIIPLPFSGGSLPSSDGLLSPSLDGFVLVSLLPELSSGGSLPSSDGLLSPSLGGFFLVSLLNSLPSSDGLLSPSLDGFVLVSLLHELSLPFSGVPLSLSLDDFFFVFTIFFEGGEAVSAGVVKPTLTPDLQDFSGFGSGQSLISCSLDLHLKHTRPAWTHFSST